MTTGLDAVRASHPQLTNSVIAQYNHWRSLVKVNSTLRKWENDHFEGPVFLDRLSDALLLDGEVLAMGDQKCLALFPVMIDSGAADTPTPIGKKAKWEGPPLLAMLAVLEEALVVVHDQNGSEDTSVGLIPRQNIDSAAPIKMRDLWVTMPGVQYVHQDDGRRRVLTAHLSDMAGRDVYLPIQSALTDPFHATPTSAIAVDEHGDSDDAKPRQRHSDATPPTATHTVSPPSPADSTRPNAADLGAEASTAETPGRSSRLPIVLGVLAAVLAAFIGGVFLLNRDYPASVQPGPAQVIPSVASEQMAGPPEALTEDDVWEFEWVTNQEFQVVMVSQGAEYALLLTDDSGSARLARRSGAAEVPTGEVSFVSEVAVGLEGWETVPWDTTAAGSAVPDNEEMVWLQPRELGPYSMYPVDPDQGLYVSTSFKVPLDSTYPNGTAPEGRMLGRVGHVMTKDEAISFLKTEREPEADDALTYDVVPVEVDGVVSMLVTDPASGEVKLGTPDGFNTIAEDQVTRQGGKAIAVLGYRTLRLGDLANEVGLDEQWRSLCIPMGTKDDSCLGQRSPAVAAVEVPLYSYDEAIDTFTRRSTGEVFSADEESGEYVSDETGEALVPGWRPRD